MMLMTKMIMITWLWWWWSWWWCWRPRRPWRCWWAWWWWWWWKNRSGWSCRLWRCWWAWWRWWWWWRSRRRKRCWWSRRPWQWWWAWWWWWWWCWWWWRRRRSWWSRRPWQCWWAWWWWWWWWWGWWWCWWWWISWMKVHPVHRRVRPSRAPASQNPVHRRGGYRSFFTFSGFFAREEMWRIRPRDPVGFHMLIGHPAWATFSSRMVKSLPNTQKKLFRVRLKLGSSLPRMAKLWWGNDEPLKKMELRVQTNARMQTLQVHPEWWMTAILGKSTRGTSSYNVRPPFDI